MLEIHKYPRLGISVFSQVLVHTGSAHILSTGGYRCGSQPKLTLDLSKVFDKYNLKFGDWACSSVEECLPSTCKVMVSIPCTTKQTKP
jgi:hypothetical protein